MKASVVGVVVFGDDGVELGDEDLNFVNELQNALGDDDDPVTFPHRGPANDAVTDDPGQVSQGHAEGAVIDRCVPVRLLRRLASM